MSIKWDIFGLGDEAAGTNPYAAIGYPRNPFRTTDAEELAGLTPFCTRHLVDPLKRIGGWVDDIHTGKSSQALSVVGTIGTGKSRIIALLRRSLAERTSDKVWAHATLLAESGYGRGSIGGLLVGALERMQVVGQKTPDGVLPIIWSVVSVPTFSATPVGPLGSALRIAATSNGALREQRAVLISRWLQRSPLSQAESKLVGLYRRIDWEGELIRVVAEFFRLARSLNTLRTIYLFIDQLEELFGSSYSDTRRSRILSDLRTLVDEIDTGAPIGLLLAWSPDWNPHGKVSLNNEVDREFQARYEALYSRLQRRRVDLPLLERDAVEPFTEEWIQRGIARDPEYGHLDAPDPSELARSAWTRLEGSGVLLPPKRATTRQLLSALANEVDRRVGVAT